MPLYRAVTQGDLAKGLRVCRQTVARELARGHLPRPFIHSRRLCAWRVNDLVDFATAAIEADPQFPPDWACALLAACERYER